MSLRTIWTKAARERTAVLVRQFGRDMRALDAANKPKLAPMPPVDRKAWESRHGSQDFPKKKGQPTE